MAMRMNNISMTSTVNKSKLLETLKKNRESHGKIVEEARKGYIDQARAALSARLAQLEKGEVVSLSFNLSPPSDYTEVYDNSIAMLEWNTQETVELEADEFRQLVRDEWDWSANFFALNSNYSKLARDSVSKKY